MKCYDSACEARLHGFAKVDKTGADAVQNLNIIFILNLLQLLWGYGTIALRIWSPPQTLLCEHIENVGVAYWRDENLCSITKPCREQFIVFMCHNPYTALYRLVLACH